MLSTTSVGDTGNVLIDSLTWGSKWTAGTGPLVISVGIKTTGGLAPTAQETAAILSTLKEFERVINVTFNFVGVDNSGQADVSFSVRNDPTSSALGWSVPAGETVPEGAGDVNILRNNYLTRMPIWHRAALTISPTCMSLRMSWGLLIRMMRVVDRCSFQVQASRGMWGFMV